MGHADPTDVGDEESKDGAPVCEGSVDDLVGGPIFLALYPYF